MTTEQSRLLRMALRLYNNPLVSKQINRHNQRAWLKSVQFLGDKWLLARQMPRLSLPRE